MTRRSPKAGTCELLSFFTDAERYSDLTSAGVAVIAGLLKFINTTGRGGNLYQAYPSHETLGRVSRTSAPTVRKWLEYFEKSEYLSVVERKRIGKRNSSKLYDVTPAAEKIIADKKRRQPRLVTVEGNRCDT